MSKRFIQPVKNDQCLLLYLRLKTFRYTVFHREPCLSKMLNSLIIVTSVTSHFSAAIYLPDKSADAALINVA